MTIHNKSKKCEHHCPVCGEQPRNIDWETMVAGDPPYQSGTCNTCGCEFDEVYHYHTTTYFSEKNDTAKQVVKAAKAIIDDFDVYGEVLQADMRSEYTPETAIEILRLAIKKYEEEQK